MSSIVDTIWHGATEEVDLVGFLIWKMHFGIEQPKRWSWLGS
jgi:hypothetical protein